MPSSSIISSAQMLKPSTPISGTLLTWNDRNYIAVCAQAGLSYSVTLTPDSSILHLMLIDASGADASQTVQNFGIWSPSIYSGPSTSGTATSAGVPGSPASFTFTAISTGVVYAEIDGTYFGPVLVNTAAPPARYTIQLGAPDDHGDTPATAGQLTIGASVSGNFDVQNDRDTFAITLQAGNTYEFDDISGVQLEMSLSNADQSRYLAYWSPYYPALTYSPDQTRIYYLSVSTRAGDGLGQYTISAKAVGAIPDQTPEAVPSQPVPSQPTPSTISIYRLFDVANGAQFLTADANEYSTLLATRPDMINEGASLQAVSSSQPSATPVFRFFDTTNGSHFLTVSASERNTLLTTRADLTFEGVGFYEFSTTQSNSTPVYRYFDVATGAHFFTSSATENATIAATRPHLRMEGIAFYSPT